ncbi:MAG: polysaccharide biosynthesis protein [Chitinophagaceae bacterium]|nr:polysaccharide biosynthesis protein [Chitinophagaceae bacterium]
MSGIKKLAGQTIWYGGSSIAARFINYLLTPYLTYTLDDRSDYGKIGLIYAAIPLLNILFTYGFETAYFRFASKQENQRTIYSTASLSLFFSTIILSLVLWMNQHWLGEATGLIDFPTVIQMAIIIIGLDALSTIPFARLRQQGRPKKFAFIKVMGVLINIFFTWFFISYCPAALQSDPESWVKYIYDPANSPVHYVVLANVLQSAFTLLFLWSELTEIELRFDSRLWKQMMLYSLPLVIAGMGGMVNETLDRLMLNWWLPGTEEYKHSQVGIYNACFKLSILITLFIQAFRMAAEPFFFKQAEGKDPQKVYARVMKFFVITVCIMFLSVSLFLPAWQYLIGPEYREGLGIVPMLLFANMFLGIYYNLSIWYKLGNKTIAGAYITIIGALVTMVINYAFIPTYGYLACAWAHFASYGVMMVVSYTWGQKEYRVPYAWKKLLAYLVIVALLFFVHLGIQKISNNIYVHLAASVALTLVFIFIAGSVEKKELRRLPFFRKSGAQGPI